VGLNSLKSLNLTNGYPNKNNNNNKNKNNKVKSKPLELRSRVKIHNIAVECRLPKKYYFSLRQFVSIFSSSVCSKP
jgi:hypothetical protein